MKRKKSKKNNLLDGFDLDASASWSVLKLFPGGRSELVASGLTFQQAHHQGEQLLADCLPGETVSLREQWVSSW